MFHAYNTELSASLVASLTEVWSQQMVGHVAGSGSGFWLKIQGSVGSWLCFGYKY